MSAIAPPPVGADAEPRVLADNTKALEILRKREARERGLAPRPRSPRGVSLAAIVGLGALTILAASVGARVTMRARRTRRYYVPPV